jgi:hypothetical protein
MSKSRAKMLSGGSRIGTWSLNKEKEIARKAPSSLYDAAQLPADTRTSQRGT